MTPKLYGEHLLGEPLSGEKPPNSHLTWEALMMMVRKFFSLSSLTFFVIYVSLCGSLQAQTLSTNELNSIRNSTVSSCFRTQKASPLNAGISDWMLTDYCSCYARVIFPNHITVEEITNAMRILQTRGNAAYLDFLLKGRDVNEISENCINQVMR